MRITYRSATVDDAAGIACVEVASLREAYRDFMPAAHLEALDEFDLAGRWAGALPFQEDDRVVVAVDAETVVGFVRAGRTREESVGFITYLFLLPEYWGVGIGKGLMAQAMAIFRDFGFTSAQLYAYCDNARARRFYEGLGWTLNGKTYTQHVEGVSLEMVCYEIPVEG